MKRERPERSRGTFRQLVVFVALYWGWGVLNIIASLGSAVTDISAGYFIKNITDFALENRQDDIVRTIYVILAVVVLGVAVKYGVKYTSGRFSSLAVRDIRTQTIRAVESLPFAELEANHSGDMVSRLTNDAYVIQNFFLDDFPNLIYQPIVFVTTFIYLFTLNAELLVWAMVIVPLTLVATNILGKPLGGFVAQRQEGLGKVDAVIQDTIGGIFMLKAFNIESALQQKFYTAVSQVRDNELRRQKRLALMTPLFIVLRTIPILSTTGYGGYLAMTGRMTPGSVFAFVYLLHFLIQPLTIIPELLAQLRGVLATAGRIMEVLHRSPERTDGQSFALEEGCTAIEFAGVSFGYNEESDVLKQTNFQIPHQKTVALVGHSGSGKSTVLKLLCGFYEPENGHVKVYGHPLDDWNLTALRCQMSLVSQDMYLFPASIADNIAYGRYGATRSEIVEAAKAANVHNFISELSGGYETEVGERGHRLSGGQRQRIGIARAILKNAPILLLDEPTSALDVHSEALVQEALERFMRGRTVLVIAHRLSTIQRADDMLVLDRGCIVENGSHQELLERDGVYKQLYLKQFQPDKSADTSHTL